MQLDFYIHMINEMKKMYSIISMHIEYDFQAMLCNTIAGYTNKLAIPSLDDRKIFWVNLQSNSVLFSKQ